MILGGFMRLYDIISNMKFIGIKNFVDQDIDSLSCNSHEKLSQGIYFCIKGLNIDGHQFAQESIENGAVCLVVEHYLDLPVTQICVENVRVAMSYVSSIFFETYKSKMKFVGVTGTNGKTTTTYLVKNILQNLGCKVGLIGTEGIYINHLLLPSNMTTPDPIDLHRTINEMESNGCEYCVMEVSAHSIALNKIDDVMFDVVALTNITKDHLDFFLNMENYVKCKAGLFDLKHAKMGVVNCNAKFSKEIIKKSNISITTVGNEADFCLKEIEYKAKGTEFVFEFENQTKEVSTNLMGEYNVSNLLMAIAIVKNLGFDLTSILKAIEEESFVIPGRFNLLDINANFNVVIDYAHTPDGLENILSTLKKLPHKRIISVFGCGGNRDKSKRREMGEIASRLSDLVVVTTDNPRDENPELIIDDILFENKSQNIVKVLDRSSAIEFALREAKENDIVAILGKGAETYQEIKGVKYHYSDFEVVDNYFKNLQKEELKA